MKKNGFLLLLTFLFFFTSASLFADTEDNDSCSQAELISAMHNKTGTYSTTVTGTVESSDDDYYYFTVVQTGTIGITYTSTDRTDLRIQAGGSCKTSMSLVLNNGTSYTDTFNVTAGNTVYIRIRRRNKTPNYSLSLAFTLDFNSSNTRDFTLVSGFPYNIKGDMQIIGNSVTLKSGGVCPKSTENNNDFDIVNVDIDGASFSTLNSSNADIQLPKGVTEIKYAGLYWQGRTQTPERLAQGTTAKIRFPNDSNYHTVTTESSKFNWYTETVGSISTTGKLYSYQGVTDVTSLLQADINKISSSTITSTGYSATVWVGDVVTDVNTPKRINGYGAWALVVVYKDETGTFRNISLYDGFRLLKYNKRQEPNVNETLTQTLSGFYTPPSGAVNSKFLFFGGEGDAGDTPNIANDGYNDYASLSNKAGTNISLGSDVFDGTITDSLGNNITARNPACANTIGVDIHTYDVGTSSTKYPIIENSQSSTTIKLTPDLNEDSYSPGVFAFSTDIYTPKLCYVENIFRGKTNISGQNVQVNADENLTVRVYVTNTDNAAAEKVQILHQFDSSFPYVDNSTNFNNNNPALQTVMPPTYTRTTATDASGDDLFEYNSTSLLAKINLGNGATSSSGGTFLYSNTTTAVFEYNATVKNTQNYSNAYKVAYKNSALNLDFSTNPIPIASCDGTTNSFFSYIYTTQGSIDIVDDYATNGYTAAMGLHTKIANKPNYTLDALWLGTGTTPINYTGSNPLPIRISLSNNMCSTDESLAQTTEGYVEATIPAGASKGTTSSFQIVNKAIKNAKLRFRYIDWNNLPGGNYSQCLTSSSTLGSLKGVPECLNSDKKILDAFGERIATQCENACQSSSYNAENLPNPPYNNALGCFICLADALNGDVCSTDNFAIRPNDFNATITVNQQFIADQDTPITFRADQYNGTGTTDYNEVMNTSFIVDANISDNTKTCTASSIQFTPNIVFTHGTVTGNYSLPNVGDFNLTMYENPGSEFALVDADDTLDTQRYITKFTRQIKVVPNSFTIDGNFTNGGDGFSYLSDFETFATAADRNVSAQLDLNISARSATNAILSNYTSLCYAKDANLTMRTTTVGNTLTNLNKLLWYDKLHDLNGSITLNNTSNYTMALDNTQFDSNETNGTAHVQYLINFDRNSTKAVQPFVFKITDVNTSDEDSRTGTKAFTDQNATYYYGRAFAPDQTYVGRNGTATIYYEVYCNNCTPATRATFGIDGNESTQAINWYQNTDHNSSSGIVTPTPLQLSKFASYPVTHSTTASVSTQTLTLQNGTAIPFTDTINLNSDNWLVYYPTYFSVSFVSSGNWAGQGDLGKTVDVNTSIRTNKRMEW